MNKYRKTFPYEYLEMLTLDILFFSGDVIMTGEGHKDWLSDCDFHPGYALDFNYYFDAGVVCWCGAPMGVNV